MRFEVLSQGAGASLDGIITGVVIFGLLPLPFAKACYGWDAPSR